MLSLIMLWVCTVTPAYAVTIGNLSDHADTVDIKDTGGFKPYVVEAGHRLDILGPVTVRYAGMVKRLDAAAEYVIWNNGIFQVQSRRK